MTFLLCDPSWYAHKPDHNKWDDNNNYSTTRKQLLAEDMSRYVIVYGKIWYIVRVGNSFLHEADRANFLCPSCSTAQFSSVQYSTIVCLCVLY